MPFSLTMRTEIKTPEDIKLLVDTFYSSVNADPLLGPVFNPDAGVDWEEHLTRMYSFWGSQLIGTGDYTGRPFPPHMKLNIGKAHFQRWVELFTAAVDEHFTGITAQMAKQKAMNIALVFQHKLGLSSQS
jgi:hemoglobin